MLHVALWEPEIPPNTGNIARLCAATGARLHLVGRLGFRLDDKALLRAGSTTGRRWTSRRHVTFEAFEAAVGRVWCVECPAAVPYTRADFQDGDCLLFGGESKGLPAAVREKYAGRLIGIPMPTGAVRSLNLATAAGIVLYDALRRLNDW